MNVLVACEYSGRTRDAFLARNHNALSCDLLPTEVPGPHYQGDVRDILAEPWRFFDGPIELMIVHPDCTYLCRAGGRWLNAPDDYNPKALKGAPRWEAMAKAVEFFQEMRDADIPRIAIENPRPNHHVTPIIGKPDQVVQPWMFGEPQAKATGFWLKNLPPLVETDNVKAQYLALPKAERDRVHYMSPGPNRWKERSRTFRGIATAMAQQWGGLPTAAISRSVESALVNA